MVARYNLAGSLGRLGRFAEARPLLEAVLADWTERYGAEHERSLRTRSDLAICMGKMGDAEGAMQEKEAVLAADELLARHGGAARLFADDGYLVGPPGAVRDALKFF